MIGAAAQGSESLAARLGLARDHIDVLIDEGLYFSAHTALTSMDSHFIGMELAHVVEGYT